MEVASGCRWVLGHLAVCLHGLMALWDRRPGVSRLPGRNAIRAKAATNSIMESLAGEVHSDRQHVDPQRPDFLWIANRTKIRLLVDKCINLDCQQFDPWHIGGNLDQIANKSIQSLAVKVGKRSMWSPGGQQLDNPIRGKGQR